MKPYQILEIANSHGGNMDYLLSLIDEFAEYKGYGMKFQPLHPDRIATPDFSWYPVYHELLFSLDEWAVILNKVAETKEIWLDLFDTYGVEIFDIHKDKVTGCKLQPSILYNQSVLNALSKILLHNHYLIINVSGLEIEEISERLQYFTDTIQPKEIWIEVGFQSYPTQLQDSGYIKIDTVRKHFSNKIVFADHADGKGEDTLWLPLVAALKGADVIEKHIMHSTMETKYDYFSSIDKNKYAIYIQRLTAYLALNDQPFINDREKLYLSNSIQIPIAAKAIQAGTLINFNTDIEFKRAGLTGLNTLQIRQLQQSMHILAKEVGQHKTFQKTDFKKATIATIIACRLKSSRLPKKALLKIGALPSVEKCIESCLRFNNVNHTILATSDVAEDAELVNYTHAPAVVFHKGDPDDVIRRYLGIIDELKVDVIVRITADMPYVSQHIIDILLKSHFETGADYTIAKESAVGTAAEIINTAALRKIKAHFPNASYSEYMTWYFQNNPEHFKLNFVTLPPSLVRNYRLTLDYQEDLDMFNAIQQYLDEKQLPATIDVIFDFLDQHPEVVNLNSHLTLKYKTDPELIATLNRETKIK
jgi:spore coat polysaccharide biosynthesis protein SpsF (cytidylyltransferase family)/sialic acid synthase SpsE